MSFDPETHLDLNTVDPETLGELSDDQFKSLLREVIGKQAADRKENQLLYYQPASAQARKVHVCRARWIGIGAGNGAGKTDTCLAEMAALTTGVIPESVPELRDKFRGPINVRVVVESITTTLHTIILPKLRWQKWNGVSEPGGEKGHWGWIPKLSLRDGDWDASWSEKIRLLTVLCRNPDNWHEVLGESTWQFMCLRGDQRVRMANGTWRAIDAVRKGEFVLHPSGSPTKVVKTHRYEDAPLLRVRCKGGREIVATPNHLHPLADARLVRSDALRPGDVIRSNRDFSSARGRALSEWELGWAAIAIGDGYIKGNDFSFTAMPGSRVLEDLPPLPPNTRLVQMPSKPMEWRIWLTKGRRGNPIVSKLKEWGLWGCGSRNKFIPDEVFRQHASARAYFLKHLWNTDGTVNHNGRQACYTTICKRLAYDVKYLLWGLGIHASVGDVKGKCGFTDKDIAAFHVVVSGGSFDRFMAAIAGRDFKHIAIKTIGQHGEVIAIESAGRGPVFCLEVDAADHLFIVDGLATHNSHEQDPTDFASGDFHIILHDEPTKHAIWVENQARTMRVNGVMMLAMTWPDDPAIPVDWIFDELYEKAQLGPQRSPHHAWIELSTRQNRNLDQRSVEIQAQNWTAGTRATRLEGRPIRFSNRIHPLFSDQPMWWSFTAGKLIEPFENDLGQPVCPETGSLDVVEFCHVAEIDPSRNFPTVFLLDPHPRKPHMFCWVQIDPADDYQLVLEATMSGTCEEIARKVFELEEAYGLVVQLRLMDPNMGLQPAAAARSNDTTWQDEFRSAGLSCDLASDSDVGRGRINEYLQPDRYTLKPRLRIASHCVTAISQFKRYCWDEHKRSLDRDLKQSPKTKYDDFPTMLKYLLNYLPSFRTMLDGPKILRRARY